MSIMLSFGPNGSFFFGSPRAWRWTNIPDGLAKTFEFNKVQQPYCVALGPANTYLMTCMGTDGQNWKYIWHEKELNDWLSAAGQDFSSLEVSLSATRDGFWACSNLGYRWHGLPSGLEKELQSRLKPDKPAPIQIGLGANDSWIVLYAPSRYGPSQRNHCSSADLVGLYPALWEIIQNDVVTYISLDAYKPGQYFVILRDHSIHWNVPEKWSTHIKSILDQYAQDQIVLSGSTPLTTFSGGSTTVVIYGGEKYLQGRDETTTRIDQITSAVNLGTAVLSLGGAAAALGCVVM